MDRPLIHRNGTFGDVSPAARRAAAVTQFNLGNALAGKGRFDEAITAYRRVIDLDPAIPEAHNNLGNALADLGRTGEAVVAYRASLALKEDSADTHVNLANALQVEGALAEALAAARRALELDPAHAGAWFVRSELAPFARESGELDALRPLAEGAEAALRSDKDRANLGFALGKAFMDIGETDLAFAQLAVANRIKRAGFDYEVEDDVRGFEALAAVVDRGFIDRMAAAGVGDPSGAPIFVLGMPRSGTTLAEQILAAHPEVQARGELDALADAVASVTGPDLPLDSLARALADLDPADFRAMAARYLAAASPLGPFSRFTDKMPGNFRFVGLIGLILPNAGIVHCARDPVDTCFSCYTKQFSGRQDFAYDLTELGRFYRAYAALMAHWRAVMPADRWLDLDYEALVEDPERETRRLLEFCGLPWTPACLSFHEQARPIRTASANQVRRPIFRSSLKRWRPYERHLHPLLEALERNPHGAVDISGDMG